MGKLCKIIVKDKSLAMSEAACTRKVLAYDASHPGNVCRAMSKGNKDLVAKADCYKDAITQKTNPFDSSFAWLLRLYKTWNYHSIGSSGGDVVGGRIALGNSFGNYTTLLGLGIGAERGTSMPHLKELQGLKDERTGWSLFFESITRKPFSKGSEWSSVDRDASGIGISSFCPASGDTTCWNALSANNTNSWYEIQYQPNGSSWYGALSFDLSTKTYLHLADDQTLRQYSHPSRDIGFLGLSLEIGQAGPTTYLDPKSKTTPPSTLSIAHEITKYGLDILGTAFSTSTSSDPLQNASILLDNAGYGNSSGDLPPKLSATTEVPTLLLLNSISGGMKQNARLHFFDRLDDSQQSAFFWGNLVNTGILMATAGAKDSGGWLQGGLSSLLQTGNFVPSFKKFSPEAAYWTRFALPHIIGATGLLTDSAGTQQAFAMTASEGNLANGFRTSDAIKTTRYTYAQLNTSQTYRNGETIENPRGEFAIEHELPSGLGARYSMASPNFSILNGNAGSLVKNIGTDSGIIDGNDAAYDGEPLSTTVSSMVGWRGLVGDSVYGTASAFVGTSVDLGPTTPPSLGITGRVSAGIGFGFTAFDTKLKLGVDLSASKTETKKISSSELGIAIMLSK